MQSRPSRPTTPEKTASVRGAQLAHEVVGDGPVELVWGHGLGQTRVSDARTALVDWPRVPARVLRYDARGHGRSTTTPELSGYTWDELARDQLALAEAAGFGPYVTAGASMGCGTALHVACLAPERVRGLVLVIPPTAWETRAAQASQWSEVGQVLRGPGGMDAFVEAGRARPIPDPYLDDPEYRGRVEASQRSWEPDRLAHVLLGASLANFPPREVVAAITAPTLILAWTGDPVHPVSTADALAELLPHAQVHIATTSAELAQWTATIASFVTSL